MHAKYMCDDASDTVKFQLEKLFILNPQLPPTLPPLQI